MPEEPPVDFEAVWSASGVAPGGELILAAIYTAPEDHHITGEQGYLLYVEPQFPEGITISDTSYSEGSDRHGEKVYYGTMAIYYTVQIAGTVEPEEYIIPFTYSYQICRDIEPEMCFLPNGGDGELLLNVLEPGASAILSTNEIFEGMLDTVPAAGGQSGGGLEGRLNSALEQGSLLAFLLVFAAGVLVSFTPCVYPMIPIIIGFVGGSAQGSKMKGFILSIFFVIGLSIMYAALGVAAGATGALFGSFMQNPIVLMAIVAIFVALGISMLGAFDIALPASVQGKLMSGQRQGLIGAVLIGAVTGIVAAPCAGPPLLVLLGWIGNSGNLLLGFLLMAVFAWGIGLLFIVIGTFAGAMTALPQAGPWMNNIKKGLGIMIFAVALYYLNFLIPTDFVILLAGALVFMVGLFMGATANWAELSTGGKYSKGIGILLVVAGLFYFVVGLGNLSGIGFAAGGGVAATDAGQVEVTDEDHVPWRVNDHDAVIADAAAEGKPVLIDFYADWCGVCVELDHLVWNQEIVITATEDYIPLKLDFTRSSSDLEELRRYYGVGGLPTVLILGPDGQERDRFTSFKTPEEVVAWLGANK